MTPAYAILMANDDRMPAGKDWLLIEHSDGVLVVLRESAVTDPAVLAQAWEAYRHYERRLPPALRWRTG